MEQQIKKGMVDIMKLGKNIFWGIFLIAAAAFIIVGSKRMDYSIFDAAFGMVCEKSIEASVGRHIVLAGICSNSL